MDLGLQVSNDILVVCVSRLANSNISKSVELMMKVGREMAVEWRSTMESKLLREPRVPRKTQGTGKMGGVMEYNLCGSGSTGLTNVGRDWEEENGPNWNLKTELSSAFHIQISKTLLIQFSTCHHTYRYLICQTMLSKFFLANYAEIIYTVIFLNEIS